MKQHGMTPAAKKELLRVYAKTGQVADAARALGIATQTAQYHIVAEGLKLPGRGHHARKLGLITRERVRRAWTTEKTVSGTVEVTGLARSTVRKHLEAMRLLPKASTR